MEALITVIPYWSGNADQTEKLIDWIFQLNDGKPKGQALVVADNEVHAESREKIKISCELAFESYEVVFLAHKHGQGNKLNQTFRKVGEAIKGAYREPFFWLEPDSVPVVKGWQKVLSQTYEKQPKRYCSGIVTGEKRFLSRHGIYPPDCIDDVCKWLDEKKNFNEVAGEGLIWRAGQMNLVAELVGQGSDTMIVHGDKDGQFLESIKASHGKI